MLLLGSFLCFHRALSAQRKFELHILEHLEVALSLTCMVSQESVLAGPGLLFHVGQGLAIAKVPAIGLPPPFREGLRARLRLSRRKPQLCE